MALTRCTSQERISKNTVLAMLRAPSLEGPNVGETVLYVDDKGIVHKYRVTSTNGQIIGLDTPDGVIHVERSKIRTNNQRMILDTLDENEWSVTSFNSKTRVVCIDIMTASGTRHIAVTLPLLA